MTIGRALSMQSVIAVESIALQAAVEHVEVGHLARSASPSGFVRGSSV